MVRTLYFLTHLIMRSVNKVILIGHLATDPEVKETQSGKTVTNFRLATNHTWVTREGEKKEEANFHKIVAWRKLGDVCGKYLKKGEPVYLEGHIRNDNYTDKEGIDRTMTEIVADTVRFITSRGNKKVEDIQIVEVGEAAAA